MSDIFKRIKSIEADEESVLNALDLDSKKPEKTANNNKSADSKDKSKPLNLTVPVDDDDQPIILNETEKPPAPDMSASHDRSKIRSLGLTPVLPVAAAGVKSSIKQSIASSIKPISGNLPKPPLDLKNSEPAIQKISPAIEKTTKTDKLAPTKVSEPVPQFVTRAPLTDETEEMAAPKFKGIMIAGIIASVIWVLGAIGFTAWGIGGVSAIAAMPSTKLLGLTALLLVPILLFILCAYALRELAKLTLHSQQLSNAAQAMMKPDETVIARSNIMSKAVQAQIEEVNLKVSQALNRMEMLDDMIKSQNSSLTQSTLAAEHTTDTIAATLTTQREALESVAETFETRMSSLSTMLDAHAENLSQSTQTAELKIHEARVSIEGAAEKINAASNVVRQNAVSAAETLSDSQKEITMLGNSVKARSDEMDNVYRKHVTDLTAMIDHLKKEQDEMGVILEERLGKMRDMSLSAKVGAQSLSEASDKGRETVEALADAARLTDTAVRARFAEMENMVKYSTARAESISDTAARQVQNSLSMTRKEIARIEADMMDLMDKLNESQHEQNIPKPVISDLDFTVPKTKRVKLRPLETDFPSLEPRELQDEAVVSPKDSVVPEPVEPESLFRLESVPNPPPMAEAEDMATSIEEDTQLTLEPISETDLIAPDTDSDIKSYDPDIVRTVLQDSTEKSNKENKTRWRWRGLFGAPDKMTETKDLNSASLAPSLKQVNDDDIITALSHMGLSPAAIVDDGCIIEATNTRKARGAKAMSQSVSSRMATPVKHLRDAVITDAAFLSDLKTFTAQFSIKLSPIEGDREAIRTCLESDAGRAFLLCDAALANL